MNQIIKHAEPFFFPGGATGCLLVHGFTGAPTEMRWLGEHLASKGHTVLGVRLFGHATQPEDMLRARWHDWLASVEDGYHMLCQACEHVIIMGLSMGGVLSLLFGSRFPVVGIVAMATPFELPKDPRLPFLRPLSWIVRFIDKGPSDWRDTEAESTHISYPRYPLRAAIELQDLLPEMRAQLHSITVPVLLINSKQDKTVPPSNAEKIFQALGTRQKDLIWVEDSGHVITRDQERQKVFTMVEEFAARIAGA